MTVGAEPALEQLRAHRGDLSRFGVKSLAVFGSLARGEARPESDADVLVEFHGPTTFDQYMELKFYLEGLLGRRVDLVTPKALRPSLLERIAREAVYVT